MAGLARSGGLLFHEGQCRPSAGGRLREVSSSASVLPSQLTRSSRLGLKENSWKSRENDRVLTVSPLKGKPHGQQAREEAPGRNRSSVTSHSEAALRQAEVGEVA